MRTFFLPTTYTQKLPKIMENNHWIVLGEVYDNRYYIRPDRKRKPRRTKQQQQQTVKNNLINMPAKVPVEIWMKIFNYCDVSTLNNLKKTCVLFCNIIDSNCNLGVNTSNNQRGLVNMPSEIILTIFGFLNKKDLANCARVCRRFRDLTAADCLWLPSAKKCLATNTCHPEMQNRSVQPWIKAQDRVRVSQNWIKGRYRETQLIVQDTRYSFKWI